MVHEIIKMIPQSTNMLFPHSIHAYCYAMLLQEKLLSSAEHHDRPETRNRLSGDTGGLPPPPCLPCSPRPCVRVEAHSRAEEQQSQGEAVPEVLNTWSWSEGAT